MLDATIPGDKLESDTVSAMIPEFLVTTQHSPSGMIRLRVFSCSPNERLDDSNKVEKWPMREL